MVDAITGIGSDNATVFSRTLLFAAFNFFILTVIFVSTLMSKLHSLSKERGDTRRLYIVDAFIKGVSLALIATGVFAVIDFISGGIATLIMFVVYPLTGVSMLILSLINPPFLRDTTAKTSSYMLWSVSFWPIFIIGMIMSLAFGALISYLGTKMSHLAMSMITNMNIQGAFSA